MQSLQVSTNKAQEEKLFEYWIGNRKLTTELRWEREWKKKAFVYLKQNGQNSSRPD